MKHIINADDFGISRGVNQAIYKGCTEGIINSVSLMVNQQYTEEAVEMVQPLSEINVGLHLNLTNERPASSPKDIPLLVGKDGKFCNGFVKLLLLSFIHPGILKRQVALEAENQIKKALQMGVALAHIDSHRHVHMIPLIFKAVNELRQQYNIPRIRVINENIFNTLKMNAGFSYLFDGGIIKYTVLKALSFWNNYPSDTYFFSILYTEKITAERLRKIRVPKNCRRLEVMVHPGMPEVDKKNLAGIFDKNVLSSYRTRELKAVLDGKCRKELEDNDCKSL